MISFSIDRLFLHISWFGLIAALAVGAWYFRAISFLPPIPAGETAAVSMVAWPEVKQSKIAIDSSVFQRKTASIATRNLGPLAKRFRLAGTFSSIGVNTQSRRAIIDDLQKKDQFLVSEGEKLADSVLVIAIFTDRVVLRENGHDEELRLIFASQSSGRGTGAAGDGGMFNRFGTRVDAQRWVLKRGSLLDYYRELLNDTERLANVFESLKPVYSKNRRITGYVLDVKGEGKMFSAFGLKQGDVVRQVNSMPMTSRRRAEYFISEFIKDRANGFVVDIERDGKPQKMVYMIR